MAFCVCGCERERDLFAAEYIEKDDAPMHVVPFVQMDFSDSRCVVVVFYYLFAFWFGYLALRVYN